MPVFRQFALLTNDSSEIIEERIVAADGDIWIQTQYEYYRLYPYSIESKKYNQSLTKGSLLLEFGTDANSLDEAKYSAELVAESLITLLNTLK